MTPSLRLLVAPLLLTACSPESGLNRIEEPPSVTITSPAPGALGATDVEIINPDGGRATFPGALDVYAGLPYEQVFQEQLATATERLGAGDLTKLLHSGDTWTVS